VTSLWKQFIDRLFVLRTQPTAASSEPGSPGVAASTGPRVNDNLPLTYPLSAETDGVPRQRVFDPALRQYSSAFRLADPVLGDEDASQRWARARRSVTDHILRAIAESPCGDSLILRGSRTLREWLGDAAREPGDLDWIVDPPTLQLTDRQAGHLISDLTKAVFARPAPSEVELTAKSVRVDDIWAYERAPGRRVAFPWRAAGLPGGSVQVDVAFAETLVEPALRMPIRAADGGCISVRAASPAQSLAWKLLWLVTDMTLQGKDLYDAVLLAERFALPFNVLEQTLRQGGEAIPATTSEFIQDWYVDWDAFQAEYPHVSGKANDWLNRLRAALEPAFRDRGGSASSESPNHKGDAPDAFDPSWLTPNVIALANWIDSTGTYDQLPILGDALEDASCGDAEILRHCRRGPHTRGCYLVDQILKRR
jgi:hypothetical protein